MSNKYGFATLAAELRHNHAHWLTRCDWCDTPMEATGCTDHECAIKGPRRYETQMRQDFRRMLNAIERVNTGNGDSNG